MVRIKALHGPLLHKSRSFPAKNKKVLAFYLKKDQQDYDYFLILVSGV